MLKAVYIRTLTEFFSNLVLCRDVSIRKRPVRLSRLVADTRFEDDMIKVAQ